MPQWRALRLCTASAHRVMATAAVAALACRAHGGGAVGGALAMWFLGPRWVRHKGRMVDKPIVPLLKDMP